MARYLLSTRTLLALATGRSRSESRWLNDVSSKGVRDSDLFYSVVAPMRLDRDLDERLAAARASKPMYQGDNVTDLQNAKNNAKQLFATYGPVSVSVDIAHQWGWLLDTRIDYSYVNPPDPPTLEPIGSAEKVELATAMVGINGIPFTYVDKKEPGHTQLARLVIEDPVALFP